MDRTAKSFCYSLKFEYGWLIFWKEKEIDSFGSLNNDYTIVHIKLAQNECESLGDMAVFDPTKSQRIKKKLDNKLPNMRKRFL